MDSSESGQLEWSPGLTTSRDNMFLMDRAPLNRLESHSNKNTPKCFKAIFTFGGCKNSILAFLARSSVSMCW